METVTKVVKLIWQIPRYCLIQVIRFYQRAISPIFPPTCRFQPSCSAYGIEALKKYGAFRGTLKTMWRIVRCNPLSKGGADPP